MQLHSFSLGLVLVTVTVAETSIGESASGLGRLTEFQVPRRSLTRKLETNTQSLSN